MSFILVPIHLSLTIPLWDLDQEDPLEKEIATHSSILAWKSHGQRSLTVHSPSTVRGVTKESDTT